MLFYSIFYLINYFFYKNLVTKVHVTDCENKNNDKSCLCPGNDGSDWKDYFEKSKSGIYPLSSIYFIESKDHEC